MPCLDQKLQISLMNDFQTKAVLYFSIPLTLLDKPLPAAWYSFCRPHCWCNDAVWSALGKAGCRNSSRIRHPNQSQRSRRLWVLPTANWSRRFVRRNDVVSTDVWERFFPSLAHGTTIGLLCALGHSIVRRCYNAVFRCGIATLRIDYCVCSNFSSGYHFRT